MARCPIRLHHHSCWVAPGDTVAWCVKWCHWSLQWSWVFSSQGQVSESLYTSDSSFIKQIINQLFSLLNEMIFVRYLVPGTVKHSENITLVVTIFIIKFFSKGLSTWWVLNEILYMTQWEKPWTTPEVRCPVFFLVFTYTVFKD